MKKLLIIITLILTAFILFSFSLYQLRLFQSQTQRCVPSGETLTAAQSARSAQIEK